MKASSALTLFLASLALAAPGSNDAAADTLQKRTACANGKGFCVGPSCQDGTGATFQGSFPECKSKRDEAEEKRAEQLAKRKACAGGEGFCVGASCQDGTGGVFSGNSECSKRDIKRQNNSKNGGSDVIAQLQATFDRNNPDGVPANGSEDDLNGDGVINAFEEGAQAA